FELRQPPHGASVDVFFALEARPPTAPAQTEDRDWFVHIPVDRKQFLSAAGSLREQLQQFPNRCRSGLPSTRGPTPQDWTDQRAWDEYFSAELLAGRTSTYADPIVRRFLSLAREKGGCIWFPGCGLDPFPKTYAENGCRVVASDFSSVAIRYQQRV